MNIYEKKVAMAIAAFVLSAVVGWLAAGWVEGDILGLTVYEFACYEDGELTERHVGVRSSLVSYSSLHKIKYVDSREVAYYMQQPGETCGLEAVVPSK